MGGRNNAETPAPLPACYPPVPGTHEPVKRKICYMFETRYLHIDVPLVI